MVAKCYESCANTKSDVLDKSELPCVQNCVLRYNRMHEVVGEQYANSQDRVMVIVSDALDSSRTMAKSSAACRR